MSTLASIFTFSLFLQQPQPPLDPNWARLWAWLQYNWFMTAVIIVGVYLFYRIVRWILQKVEDLGIIPTVLLIIVSAILVGLVIWLIGLFIPKAVSFGPASWNQGMIAAQQQPQLLVPGEAQVVPPGDSGGGADDSGGGRAYQPVQYTINDTSPDRCATLREGPDQNATKLGCIPNGTIVNVVELTPSNEVNGVSQRGRIDPVAGFPAGWIHMAVVAP